MKIYLLSALLALASFTRAQEQCIAFYNQENLFDTIDDPHKNDNEFLPYAEKEWNTEKYRNKIHNMARVIASMNQDKGPDIIGMCEVENEQVLKDLVNNPLLKPMNYHIIHYESPDERGIDNALLYKSNEWKLIHSVAYPVTIKDNKNFKTRDILLVKLQAKNQSEVIVLVNHFPSRLGGEKKSHEKRYCAAEVLKHIFDSIATAAPHQAVIAMGDFNDEPTDKSLDSVLEAKASTHAAIYNAMFPLKTEGKGSLFYRGKWLMFDQVLMNKSVSTCTSDICYVSGSASVYEQSWMLEATKKHKYIPLRTYSDHKYLGGFSDHLPVYIYVELKGKK